MKKGLLVFIYRNELGDCTANGVSSKEKSLVLLDAEGPFEPKADMSNALVLVTRVLHHGTFTHAEPVVKPEGMIGPMFGGNFIYTSDSRFPSRQPIAIWDRFETQQQYDSNSN